MDSPLFALLVAFAIGAVVAHLIWAAVYARLEERLSRYEFNLTVMAERVRAVENEAQLSDLFITLAEGDATDAYPDN